MRWVAIVPLRSPAQGKTRLSSALGPTERMRLVERMFEHVSGVLLSVPTISDVVVLSEERPKRWQGSWLADKGQGLNCELVAATANFKDEAILVIHADLPVVSKLDVTVLLVAARSGCAIAPDRHGTGTNALALTHAADFDFAFGPGSFLKHVVAAQGRQQVVRRLGFALDIDTPADLAIAAAKGVHLDLVA